MRTFLRQLRPALIAMAVLTVVLGVAYPLVVTLVAQVAFHDQANGSIIEVDGTAVGSRLIGQDFSAPKYFWPRPSSAGAGYDGASSSGSNLGPLNSDLLDAIGQRAAAYRQANGLAPDALVPVDAVTASGSGLDPHISVANARIQAARVASVRDLPLEQVMALIDEHTDGRAFGILGDPGVNVLELNLALDRLSAT